MQNDRQRLTAIKPGKEETMVTQVFYSRNDLATYFGCSRDTILRYEREMRKLIPDMPIIDVRK